MGRRGSSDAAGGPPHSAETHHPPLRPGGAAAGESHGNPGTLERDCRLGAWCDLGLGHLPGDIRIETAGGTIFLPLATSILISVVLTVILNLVLRMIKK
jgi:hypothetical protein